MLLFKNIIKENILSYYYWWFKYIKIIKKHISVIHLHLCFRQIDFINIYVRSNVKFRLLIQPLKQLSSGNVLFFFQYEAQLLIEHLFINIEHDIFSSTLPKIVQNSIVKFINFPVSPVHGFQNSRRSRVIFFRYLLNHLSPSKLIILTFKESVENYVDSLDRSQIIRTYPESPLTFNELFRLNRSRLFLYFGLIFTFFARSIVRVNTVSILLL